MNKTQMIAKIIQTTSVVEFYKLKENILEIIGPAGEPTKPKKDKEVN